MPQLWIQEDLVVFNNGTFGASWFASVLNNEAGRNWIKQFREKNIKCKVRTRARSKNRKQAFIDAGRTVNDYYCSSQQDCPRKTADRFVLYLEQNNRRNKDVKVGEYLDGGFFGWEKVDERWSDGNDSYVEISTSQNGNFTAKWNEKRQYWVAI